MIGHKAKLVLAVLGASSALILTACGNDGPDCGDPSVKDTVIAIVRDPKEFLGFLVRSEHVANSGTIGEAFIGQWYGKMSKEPWSKRKPKVEAAIAELKEKIATLESRQERALDMQKRAKDELENCNAQQAERLRAVRGYRPNGSANGFPMRCDGYNQINQQFGVEIANLPTIAGQISRQSQELKSLEAELSADHPNPPSFADAVEIKFSAISEVERRREQKTLFCEARLAVKIKYPELTDLGTVHLLYKIQPNLAKASDYTVYIAYP